MGVDGGQRPVDDHALMGEGESELETAGAECDHAVGEEVRRYHNFYLIIIVIVCQHLISSSFVLFASCRNPFQMSTLLRKPMHVSSAVRTGPLNAPTCRPSEWVIVIFFVYTAGLAVFRGIALDRLFWALVCPVVLIALFALETKHTRPWSRFLRHWLPLTMILAGYYQIELFAAPALVHLQEIFISWDRTILVTAGLQAAVESLGSFIPTVLEIVYLFLYSVPPLAMAMIYFSRLEVFGDRFLRVFFLGTFVAYALLPHFPTLAPRVVYPDVAQPNHANIWRTINLYNLRNLDISTSVFPSGHVAVAFSAAFGLLEVMAHRRMVVAVFFAVAVIVYMATIYCRYHYAADGAASILISALCWKVSRLIWRPEAPRA